MALVIQCCARGLALVQVSRFRVGLSGAAATVHLCPLVGRTPCRICCHRRFAARFHFGCSLDFVGQSELFVWIEQSFAAVPREPIEVPLGSIRHWRRRRKWPASFARGLSDRADFARPPRSHPRTSCFGWPAVVCSASYRPRRLSRRGVAVGTGPKMGASN